MQRSAWIMRTYKQKWNLDAVLHNSIIDMLFHLYLFLFI